MGRIKALTPKTIFTHDRSVEYPSFSMRYMTRDERYRMERFERQTKDRLLALDGLYELMVNVTAISWAEWFLRAKKQSGLETLSSDQIRDSLKFQAPKQTSYLSARFGNGDKYRLIGFKQGEIFYILGFDLNFSAYDHG